MNTIFSLALLFSSSHHVLDVEQAVNVLRKHMENRLVSSVEWEIMLKNDFAK